MPPLAAAATAIGGAFATAATAVAGTAVGGVFLTAGASGVGMTFAGKLLAGVALSAMSRALAPKPKFSSGAGGMRISMTFGEDQPQTFIFGRYSTPGDLVYHNSWGASAENPNEFYVMVIELADLPASLSRIWINGEFATLRTAEFPWSVASPGQAVEGYKVEAGDRLLVKFYDGTQTTADPYLLEKFGDDPDRPYLPDMIGRGIPYVIITAGQRKQIHRQKPEVKVELIGRHYDRRFDSTAGGVGAQRWNNWNTWQPSSNPIVHLDNLLRGIRDPITGEFMWGGQDIGNPNLPASVWFAAMNECVRLMPIAGGGTEQQYRCGLEVHLDEAPATVAEELLKACQGQIAQVAGQWHVRAGPPPLPVYSFTDDDIIADRPEDFDPFPGLDEAYNEVAARYPEAGSGWAVKDSPAIKSPEYLAEDGGRRNAAVIQFPSVPYTRQVQRLCASALKDSRRFRRHAFCLPSIARALTPLDEVAWTSLTRGYESKAWSLASMGITELGLSAVGLQERDPEDYDWDAVDELPTSVGWEVRPRVQPAALDFAVEGAVIRDGAGNPRRAAIRLLWTVRTDVTGIRYRIRLAADGSELPTNSMATAPDPTTSVGSMNLDGVPATLDGVEATFSHIEDVSDGNELIEQGILPNTSYLVQAIYEPTPRHKWSLWLPVTTPDVRLGEDDLDPTIVDKVNETKDAVDFIAGQSQQAYDKAMETSDRLDAVAGPEIERLTNLANQLEGLDLGTVDEMLGVAVAGTREGWVKDRIFYRWASSVPVHWGGNGLATYSSRATDGPNPSAILFDVPSGSASVNVNADSSVEGQMPEADPAAPYVVVGINFRMVSGSLAGAQLRPEWRIGGTWTRGEAFGLANNVGWLTSNWGFSSTAGRMQSSEAIWKKPAGTADAVRVILYAKLSSSNAAVSMRVDALDIRAPSEGEVKGFLANGYADAAITNFEVELTGPNGAIAASQQALRTEFGPAIATATSTAIAASNATEAFAGILDNVQAQFGGQNLVKNPTFDMQGVTAPGIPQAYWGSWDEAFQVVQRNTASAIVPIATAPRKFIARVDGGGTLREVRAHAAVPIKAGQQVQGVLRAAGGVAGASSEIWMRFRWLDAEGVVVGNPTNRVLALTGAGWVTTDHAPVQPPAGAVSFETWIRIPPTGTLTPVYFTDVEVVIADRVAMAEASRAMVVAADANTAVGSIQDAVRVSFADFSAMVSATATAVATSNFAGSAYVLRAVAGGGAADLRVVAWDDETGSGGAILLNADNVIAPGTLSTGMLVVTDFGWNLVPDDQIQSARSWSNSQTFVVNPLSGQENSDSRGDIRYIYSASHTTQQSSSSAAFPVIPGKRLMCSYQVQRLSGTTMTVQARVQFLAKNGAGIGAAPIIDSFSGVATAVQSLSRQIIIPAGARLARIVFDVMPGTNGNVRFMSPKIHYNEDASVLITPDGAFFTQLQAVSAWIQTAMIGTAQIVSAHIQNAAVDTLQIAGNAVTIPVYTFGTATVALTTTDTVIATIVIPRTAGFVTRLAFSTQYDLPGGYARFSFWRGATELRASHQPQSAQQNSASYTTVDLDTSGGSTTYTLRGRRVGGSTDGNVYQRFMEAQQFKR